jgi:hypothetical protein
MVKNINPFSLARRAFEAHYPTTQAACPLDRDNSNFEKYVFQVTQTAWELYANAWEASQQSIASMKQSFELHVTQADEIKELLDMYAPDTQGNVVNRFVQVLLKQSDRSPTAEKTKTSAAISIAPSSAINEPLGSSN